MKKHTEHIADWHGGVQVAESDPRLVKNVALLGAVSANGYTYSTEAMTGAVALYNKKPVFLDHEHSKHLGRKPEALAGKVENPRFEHGRIYGDIRTLDTPSGNTFRAIATADIAGFGMSHVVLAKRSQDGKSVERIDQVISVDAVHNPATTSSFTESADDPPQPSETPPMNLEEMKKSHPDLLQQIESAAAIKARAELNSEAAAEAQKASLKKHAEEAVAAERKRVIDISALCKEARLPQLEASLLTSGASIEEARKTLFAEMCKKNPAPSDDPSGDTLGEGADPDKKFKKEYSESREYYISHGISEADYVKSRRVDEGLDLVKVGENVKK